MNGIRSLVLLAATVVPTAVAGAGDPVRLQQLFPREAEVHVDGTGLSRLVLPVEVLAECRPDLSDLRLFDRDEREVPFVIDRGPDSREAVEIVQRFEPPVLAVERAETGRWRSSPLRTELYELGIPAEQPLSGSWTLVLVTEQSEFVTRVRVEALAADSRVAVLVEGASLFRLGGARPVENLRIALPAFEANRLRLLLETEREVWLEPSFRLESARRIDGGRPIAVPLEIGSIERTGGTTVVRLVRPRGVVPDLLRVETTTGSFDRLVRVRDDGAGAMPGLLGSASLFRLEAPFPVGDQELELRPAHGDALRVEIDDGDSPPLDRPSFSAVIRQPALVFELPAAGAGRPAGILRFGGARAHRPRYDLAGLLPRSGAIAERARASAALQDDESLAVARLASVRPNPEYDGAPALAFAMRPGASIERGSFARVRELHVPAAREGLTRITLDAADLAVLNDDLSDLRIADDASRQWPYVVRREAVRRLVPLAVEGPDRRDSESRYELRPPVPRLRLGGIEILTGAAFVDRAFRLVAEDDDGDTRTLVRGRLLRRAGDAGPLAIDFAPERVRSLALIVEDGDEAPLPLDGAQARIDCPEIYLTAPEGRYTMLLGGPDQRRPRYELERVRDVVLAVEAASAEPGPLRENPDASLRTRLDGKGVRQHALLWVVLIAAVLLLGGMTLRLAGRTPHA